MSTYAPILAFTIILCALNASSKPRCLGNVRNVLVALVVYCLLLQCSSNQIGNAGSQSVNCFLVITANRATVHLAYNIAPFQMHLSFFLIKLFIDCQCDAVRWCEIDVYCNDHQCNTNLQRMTDALSIRHCKLCVPQSHDETY